MEKDPEITGQEGSHYTAPFWQYDSRIGRRWNVDPVNKPWESSYLAFSGNPVLFSDPNGDNADWFQNEKTGEIFYHPDMKKGDEGTGAMTGEGWVHMGENGMFGSTFSADSPEDMINTGEYGTGSDWAHINESGLGEVLTEHEVANSDDSDPIWEEKFQGVMFSPENAQTFMSDRGYNFLPVLFKYHHDVRTEYYPEVNGQVASPHDNSEVEEIISSRYISQNLVLTNTIIVEKYRESEHGSPEIYGPMYSMRDESWTIRKNVYGESALGRKAGNVMEWFEKNTFWKGFYEDMWKTILK